MAVQLQVRRDTAANWTSNNPTLAEGEIGWETDTDQMKIGDGVTAWTSLAYWPSGGGGGATQLSDLTDVNTSTATNRNVLVADGIDWESRALVEADISDLQSYSLTGHTHSTADITSGTFANARIAQSNVTQHQAALTITESQISDLGSYSLTGHTHATTDIISGTFADARIAQSNVTQHQGALSITESQISDLGTYLTTVQLNDNTDVTITGPLQNRDALMYNGAAWVDRPLVEADISDLQSYALASHTHAAGDVTSGTFADARISQSSVTQHQAALTITESQISDLGAYLTSVPTLNTVGNVTITGAVSGQVLEWNGSAWVNATPASGVTDHTLLTNIGTNTHAQIDTHIADAAVHGPYSLNDLTDTNLGVLSSGDILRYDGVEFLNFPLISATAGNVITLTGGGVYWDGDWADVTNKPSIPASLADLTDVNTATVTNRNVLVADGVDFESRPLVEADISDLGAYLDGTSLLQDLANVSVGITAAGQYLQWNGSSWTNVNFDEGLGDLNNVTEVSPVLGNVLYHNGTNWVNQNLPYSAVTGTPTTIPYDLPVACSGEDEVLTTGTNKVRFRMPRAMTLTAVRASVNVAPTGGVLTVDINESGTSVLSTKLTIDSGETTSTTAATAAVISDSVLADDAEISVDIDAVNGSPEGLKIYLIGTVAL